MHWLPPWDLRRAEPPEWRERRFVSALLSGGDSRVAVDRATGVNRYFCPPRPAPEIACLASCTASPISAEGFAAASACYREISEAGSPDATGACLARWHADVEAGLLAYFGAEALAEVIVLPSGTDAVLLMASMLALESGDRPTTAILPSLAETGTGVPRAVTCRSFDPGHRLDAPVVDREVTCVEVPLRKTNGDPRDDGEICAAFSAAAAAARGRPIVYLTHGSKTDLVAPLEVPPGADVVVDACQMRIAPSVVRRYLRRGWPVIVTGSKFLGGPPFSGAVLLPRGRFARVRDRGLRAWHAANGGVAGDTDAALGPLLRWVSALSTLPALAKPGLSVPATIARLVREVECVLSQLPNVRLLAGSSPSMFAVREWPASIVTFAIDDPAEPGRLLTADELRPVYRDLARAGVLVGQPVELGRVGGLRVAISARDVITGDVSHGLRRLVDRLRCLERRAPAPVPLP